MSTAFEKMQLLEHILERKKGGVTTNLKTVAIISVQHLIETTGSLFECLLRLGIPSQNMLIMGKLYSTNSFVVSRIRQLGIEVKNNSDSDQPGLYYELFKEDCQKLWIRFLQKIRDYNIKTIIVLDDGGVLISTVPNHITNDYCIIGVEQTTSGIEYNKDSPISIISVAGSAVKRFIEPAFISQAVLQKAKKYLLKFNPKNIGIIGIGNIGRALIHDLDKYKISVYDIKQIDNFFKENVNICSTLDELFFNCDFIIGATGKDISSPQWLNSTSQNKILLSVSSGDIEFKKILIQGRNSLKEPVLSLLDNVLIQTRSGDTLTVLRGGTPINFDNNKHSVLPEHIQLTRALLLIGIIQAIESSNELCNIQRIAKLDPTWQKEILSYWQTIVDVTNFDFPISIKEIFKNRNFVETESFGT